MTDTDEPVTRRELVEFRDDVRQLAASIDRLREEMGKTYTRTDVLEPRLKAMESVISKHDDWLTWAQRIVLGAVIVALLGLVLASNGGLP